MKFNTMDLEDMSVGVIVATDYRKADVFKKYGIDFCCGGKKKLAEACKIAEADLDSVVNDLEEYNTADLLPSQNIYYWEVDFLCDYIVNTHHQYVRQALPYLKDYCFRVAQNHEKRHSELKEVETLLADMVGKLTEHMDKEETIIFPMIKKMATLYRHPDFRGPHDFTVNEIEFPLHELEHEHEEAGDHMHRLREITSNYTIPSDACLTYTVFFKKLKEFEDDLMIHIHLENNILFPRSLQMAGRYDLI